MTFKTITTMAFILVVIGIYGFIMLKPYTYLPIADMKPYSPYLAYKNNIEVKCGVLGSDYLWTTAMQKISNCIDRLESKNAQRIDEN